ncbi:hypothetical protein AB0M43_34755 [Longispora sp. NPDC051575]|uniref:hypothetical protein n=1 Tax=Longispora sp. NPDC051575 TaxID=3154943 RepID=UPI003438252D
MKRLKSVVLTDAERHRNAQIAATGLHQIARQTDHARHGPGPGGWCVGCQHNGLARKYESKCRHRA